MLGERLNVLFTDLFQEDYILGTDCLQEDSKRTPTQGSAGIDWLQEDSKRTPTQGSAGIELHKLWKLVVHEMHLTVPISQLMRPN